MQLALGYVGEVLCVFFFFQAEDGIRDYKVTGVQTCALPISPRPRAGIRVVAGEKPHRLTADARIGAGPRSEERRVGKSVDLGGRRIIKKKKKRNQSGGGVA